MGNNVTPYREESSRRIQFLIDEYCSGSQQVFADRCKIGKSSVSQYVKGVNAPTNLRASEIAKVFGVNPVWIMGFDAPMLNTTPAESIDKLRQDEMTLLVNYNKLDDMDKGLIQGQILGLLQNDKYKKDLSEAPAV